MPAFSLRSRFALFLAAMALVLLLPSVYAVHRLTELSTIVFDLQGRQMEAGEALRRSQVELRELDRFTRAYIISGDGVSRRGMRESLDRAESAVDELRRAGYGAESRAFGAEMREVRQRVAAIERLVKTGRSDDAVSAFQRFKPLLERASTSLQPVAAAIDGRSRAGVARVDQTVLATRWIVWIAAALAPVLAVLLGLWTARALTRPLERLGQSMSGSPAIRPPRLLSDPVQGRLGNPRVGDARVEAGPLQLSDLLFAASRPFTALARQKDIHMAIELAPSIPGALPSDVDRLRSDVLGNLLSNAFHYTDEGGRITLRARGDAEGLRIEVEDSGRGIAASRLPHLFDGARPDGADASAGATGLSIARDAVQALGGEIGVVSDVGIGTTFWFTIPLEASAAFLNDPSAENV